MQYYIRGKKCICLENYNIIILDPWQMLHVWCKKFSMQRVIKDIANCNKVFK